MFSTRSEFGTVHKAGRGPGICIAKLAANLTDIVESSPALARPGEGGGVFARAGGRRVSIADRYQGVTTRAGTALPDTMLAFKILRDVRIKIQE